MPKENEPIAKGKMRPKPGAPPGIETDGHGNVIPLAERTEDDRRAALAGKNASVKNPENEAEDPASMPRDLQGKGGRGPDRDPKGQQGGQH